MFTAASFTTVKIRKQTRCPPVYVHTMKCYSAIRKKKILPFMTTQTEFMGIMLGDQTARERQTLHGIYLMEPEIKLIETENRKCYQGAGEWGRQRLVKGFRL